MITLKISNIRTVRTGDILMLKVRDVAIKGPGRWEWNVEFLDLMAVRAELDQEEVPK